MTDVYWVKQTRSDYVYTDSHEFAKDNSYVEAPAGFRPGAGVVWESGVPEINEVKHAEKKLRHSSIMLETNNYLIRAKKGARYYSLLRANIIEDVREGIITFSEAKQVQYALREVKEWILHGDWLTAQEAMETVQLSIGNYKKDILVKIGSEVAKYRSFPKE